MGDSAEEDAESLHETEQEWQDAEGKTTGDAKSESQSDLKERVLYRVYCPICHYTIIKFGSKEDVQTKAVHDLKNHIRFRDSSHGSRNSYPDEIDPEGLTEYVTVFEQPQS